MARLEDVLGSWVNVAVLRYLAAVPHGPSGNEVARKLSLQQSSVRQALERLVRLGVVSREDVGRSASYVLNDELAFTRKILRPLFEREAGLRAR